MFLVRQIYPPTWNTASSSHHDHVYVFRHLYDGVLDVKGILHVSVNKAGRINQVRTDEVLLLGSRNLGEKVGRDPFDLLEFIQVIEEADLGSFIAKAKCMKGRI